MEFNFSGSLIINEYNIDATARNRSYAPPKPQAPQPLVQNVYAQKVSIPKLDPPTENLYPVRKTPIPSAPTLSKAGSVSSLSSVSSANSAVIAEFKARIQGQSGQQIDLSSSSSLSSWILTANIKPQSETSINFVPSLITTHENLVFCMDPSSFLTIFERFNSAELKAKNSLKLSVPNVRAIAANDNYFAVAYAGLKKDQMKGTLKTMNPNGVILFRREQFVVCTVYDKVLELKNNEAFKSPSGLAFSDRYLLVCDRELRTVFKIDFKTGVVVQRLCLKDGEPYSISTNRDNLIINDIINSSIYVFNIESFSQINCTNLKVIDQLSGAFTLALTEENLCFVRNSENQITLLDAYLEQRAYFNEIQAKILSMAFLSRTNQMLVVGTVNSKQQYKLYGYFVQ